MPAGRVWNGSAFVSPSSYKVWNGSSFVDASSLWVWNGSAFIKVWPLQVAYDATGANGVGTGASASWSHTATGPVIVAARVQSSSGIPTLTATYGSDPMTLLDSVVFHSTGVLALFGILAPAAGSQTITLTATGGIGLSLIHI